MRRDSFSGQLLGASRRGQLLGGPGAASVLAAPGIYSCTSIPPGARPIRIRARARAGAPANGPTRHRGLIHGLPHRHAACPDKSSILQSVQCREPSSDPPGERVTSPRGAAPQAEGRTVFPLPQVLTLTNQPRQVVAAAREERNSHQCRGFARPQPAGRAERNDVGDDPAGAAGASGDRTWFRSTPGNRVPTRQQDGF